MSLSNSMKYSLTTGLAHIMTLQNRSTHKDSKKSLFAPVEKKTMFGSDFVQLDVSLDRRTTIRWTRIESDDNVYIDEDWIGRLRLHGRGLDQRTSRWTGIGVRVDGRGSDDYVYMEQDQIGVHLAGRGLDRCTYRHTHIHTH